MADQRKAPEPIDWILAHKYEQLTGRRAAVIVPAYDHGWWMGTLCAHDGPEFHVSGLDTEDEVLGAANAVMDYLLVSRGKAGSGG